MRNGQINIGANYWSRNPKVFSNGPQRFIKGDGQYGIDPTEPLTNLLSLAPHSSNVPVNHLDRLYLDILTRLFPMGNDITSLKRFKLVVGRIMAAVEPLSFVPLRELCRKNDSVDVVALITKLMGSLLNGVNQRSSEPVRPLHSIQHPSQSYS